MLTRNKKTVGRCRPTVVFRGHGPIERTSQDDVVSRHLEMRDRAVEHPSKLG